MEKIMDSQEKITLIIDWVQDNPEAGFDTTYVYDLQDKLDKYGALTKNQDIALDNIIARFEMEAPL